ncbi:MAG: hypothetical protein RMM29_01070 [Planctomycetota bacterium]|nr:hypothetical protein [Planctomycetota bacterium]MCX8040397.1 hypothetical protein [Planctomycetota bacterium]MDW8372227.1 hypothetical protein [Planctomycetota bacterium]
MHPVPVGSKIRVIANSNHHNYIVGQVYTVDEVDDDGTFKARDGSGHVGNWLHWQDCQPVIDIGWEFCRRALPTEAVELLEAFVGIENIELRHEIVDRILRELPDLEQRIRKAKRALAAEVHS